MALSPGCRAACAFALALFVILAGPRVAPAQQVLYYYDALNRLVGVVDPQGHVAVYTYL